jgi:hypothetical protein
VTGRDAVTAMLRLIGAVAPGESIDATEATDGLASVNRMLGSWANDGLLIHAITAESAITLTPGDATYTLGASGDITTRPQVIEKALIRDGSTDYPVRILTLEEYAAIPVKTTQSTLPYSLYDDGGYPRRTLTLYPVPSAAKSLLLWTKRPLTALALDTDVSLPPGYEEAIVYNGAIRLSPEYGRPVPAEVAAIAANSLDAISRANHRPALLSCDAGVLSYGSRYDINTGGYR